MSDYSDILYDHRLHTHASCIKEVPGADMMILLIGSRFGGSVVPQALPSLDLDAARAASTSSDLLDEANKLSITQVEVVKAIESGVPIFAFVDARVYSDHHVYISNKKDGIADKIIYPSIDKPETAAYIFEFISFLTHRLSNNAITPFHNFGDIEDHLLRQWSLLFQRLTQEERQRSTEARRSDIVIDQIEDLKAAILQSISQGDARNIAKNVMKFRRVADFLVGFRTVKPNFDYVGFDGSMNELLEDVGVVNIVSINRSSSMYRTAFILDDGTYVGMRLPLSSVGSFYSDWNEFRKLDQNTKSAIIEGVAEANTHLPLTRYSPEQFSTFEGDTALSRADGDRPAGFIRMADFGSSLFESPPQSGTNIGAAPTIRREPPPPLAAVPKGRVIVKPSRPSRSAGVKPTPSKSDK